MWIQAVNNHSLFISTEFVTCLLHSLYLFRLQIFRCNYFQWHRSCPVLPFILITLLHTSSHSVPVLWERPELFTQSRLHKAPQFTDKCVSSVSSALPGNSPFFRHCITACLCLAVTPGIPGKPRDVPCEVISGYSRQQLFHSTSAVFQFSCRGPLETTNEQDGEPLRQGKGQGTVTFASTDLELFNCNITGAHITTASCPLQPSAEISSEGYRGYRFSSHRVPEADDLARGRLGHQVRVCSLPGTTCIFLLHKQGSAPAGRSAVLFGGYKPTDASRVQKDGKKYTDLRKVYVYSWTAFEIKHRTKCDFLKKLKTNVTSFSMSNVTHVAEQQRKHEQRKRLWKTKPAITNSYLQKQWLAS